MCILCMPRLDMPHCLSEYRDSTNVTFILHWSTEACMMLQKFEKTYVSL